MADANSSTCRKCGETKPLSAFSVIKKTGKPNPYCKLCRSRLAGEYAAQHRDERKAYNVEYRQNNLERLREYDRERSRTPERHQALVESRKAWAQKYPEKRRAIQARHDAKRSDARRLLWATNKARMYARNRAWVLAHPEQAAEHQRRYRLANPHKVREHWRNRGARRRNAGGTHTAADIQRLLKLQRGCCAACGKPMKTYHVDHRIALSRGGSNHWTNLQLLHPRCNLRKHARDPIEFMQTEHGLLL